MHNCRCLGEFPIAAEAKASLQNGALRNLIWCWRVHSRLSPPKENQPASLLSKQPRQPPCAMPTQSLPTVIQRPFKRYLREMNGSLFLNDVALGAYTLRMTGDFPNRNHPSCGLPHFVLVAAGFGILLVGALQPAVTLSRVDESHKLFSRALELHFAGDIEGAFGAYRAKRKGDGDREMAIVRKVKVEIEARTRQRARERPTDYPSAPRPSPNVQPEP